MNRKEFIGDTAHSSVAFTSGINTTGVNSIWKGLKSIQKLLLYVECHGQPRVT